MTRYTFYMRQTSHSEKKAEETPDILPPCFNMTQFTSCNKSLAQCAAYH